MLGILGVYSLYLLYLGLPVLMKSPKEKALGYTLVVVLAAIVLLGALLVYLLIIALKFSLIEQELADLTQAAREKLGG